MKFLDHFFGDMTDNQIMMIVSSVVAFGVTLCVKKFNANQKLKWKKVGTLSKILCFPVKSCGAIQLKESECSLLGLKKGFLRDRVFMVVNHDGEFVTGRTLPKLTQIEPRIDGSELKLKAKGMPDISINIPDLQKRLLIETSVWGQEVSTVDCGDEVANWLTRLLLEGVEPGLRLVYYPSEEPSRSVRPKNAVFEKCTPRDVGALSDATSYNLMTESSVGDLNTHLAVPAIPEQFRSNFIVRGTKPYAEDNWDWIRIGDVIFRNIKPCTRCMFTTVDPRTGLRNPSQEPLMTLKSYRQIGDLNLLPHTGNSPVLGIHLALLDPGIVRVGDDIYVK